MQAVVRPEAAAELLDAQTWYEARSPGLGFEFARAIDSAICAALRNPLAYPRIESEFRRVILRRFPYAVIYYVSDETLVVVACFHHRRQPRSWGDRVTSE